MLRHERRKFTALLIMAAMSCCFLIKFLLTEKQYGFIQVQSGVKCNDTLNRTSEVNAGIVRNYPIGDSGPFLNILGLVRFQNKSVRANAQPTIVTAASVDHFAESVELLRHLQNDVFPKVGKLKIIYFDLGLSSSQLQRIHDVCGCEVRGFPFEQYPAHVRNLRRFAWKPIAIQSVLKTDGFVMWMDSSVRIRSGDLMQVFSQAKQQGIVLPFSDAEFSLSESTDVRTMRHLGEQPCTFREEKEFYATFIIIHKSPFVLKHIMRPWLSCALTDGCMSMTRDSTQDCVHRADVDIYGVCHRFDQSVLSIILHRLFHGNIKNVSFGNRFKWQKCGSTRPSYRFLPNFVNEYFFHTHC